MAGSTYRSSWRIRKAPARKMQFNQATYGLCRSVGPLVFRYQGVSAMARAVQNRR